MTGYDAYLKGFTAPPKYERIVWHPWAEGKSLSTWLNAQGAVPNSERLNPKILSAADGAKTYSTKRGGFIEVMQDMYSGEYIAIIIPADQAQKYKKYASPLPFWLWCMG